MSRLEFKVRVAVLLCLACALATDPLAAADDIVHEKVVDKYSDAPVGPYKHPASFTELANGDLYLAYYSGSDEYSEDTAVCGMRKPKGSDKWNKPVIIADTPDKSEGNPVVWQGPDGKVWLFYVVNYGDTWSQSRIQYKISTDGAQTWSDPVILAFEEGMMVRGRPIVLNNGDYLLPIYHETGNDPERTAPDTTSLFMRYRTGKNVWEETNRIYSRNGNLQPSVVQIDDDYLIAYCRRGGPFGPDPDGFIIRSESRNGGYTWSRGKDTEFANPNSAIDFIKLANGHLLLVYNDNNEGVRMPLTVAVSTDNDKTYPHRRNVVDVEGTAAYPVAIQAADGKIHVIYTSHRRTQINHIWFDESAILDHRQ